MVNTTPIISTLRELLKEGNIEDAITTLDRFLNENEVPDNQITDGLITVSSKYRNLVSDYKRHTIDFATYDHARTRVSDSMVWLINKLQLALASEDANTSLEIISHPSNYIQDESLTKVRGELITSDHVILTLLKELSEKEKELLKIQSEAQIEALKREIETLNNRVQEEERKYAELQERYEIIKKSHDRLGELTQENLSLKKEIEKFDHTFSLQEEIYMNQQEMLQSLRERMDDKEKVLKAYEDSNIRLTIKLHQKEANIKWLCWVILCLALTFTTILFIVSDAMH